MKLRSMKFSRPMTMDEFFAAHNIALRPADTFENQIELSALEHAYLAKGLAEKYQDILFGNSIILAQGHSSVLFVLAVLTKSQPKPSDGMVFDADVHAGLDTLEQKAHRRTEVPKA